MAGTPFNPQKYSAQQVIVNNYKLLYSELHSIGYINHPLTLEDADIWDSYDSFGEAEADDAVFPEVRNRYDAMVLQDMKYKMEHPEARIKVE